jgi:hypothetical protein
LLAKYITTISLQYITSNHQHYRRIHPLLVVAT